MPGVDSQFIDYLQEIGAKFTIYHTGDKSRIQINKASTTQTNEKSAKVEKRAITKDKNQLSLFEDNLSNNNDGEVGTDTYVESSDESSAENTGDKKSSNNDLDPNDITNENTKC